MKLQAVSTTSFFSAPDICSEQNLDIQSASSADYNLTQTLILHPTEKQIVVNRWLSSAILLHFWRKEAKVMMTSDINDLISGISICKL